jgi:hypothetical protein
MRGLLAAADLEIVRHAYCILAIGRATIRAYRWSQRVRVRFPIGLLIALAHLDRRLGPWLPLRPYDIVVEAERAGPRGGRA